MTCACRPIQLPQLKACKDKHIILNKKGLALNLPSEMRFYGRPRMPGNLKIFRPPRSKLTLKYYLCAVRKSRMNRRILRLAIPNVISNITIPLLGLISIMIAGRLGNDSAIAAIGVGAAVFSFIYWNCAFIRMGASGMTAQAFGARNFQECANILVRALSVALAIALLLLVFQRPVGNFGMKIMGEGDDVTAMAAKYFFARIWAAPATISHYAIQGWFIGMQNSKTPMVISICINVFSIIFSFIFVDFYGMGVEGIAYGIVVAQYLGIVLSVILWLRYYRRFLKYMNLKVAIRWKPMLRFFDVNKDIFIRTFCNTLVYTFFPFISHNFGTTMLATNTILIQLFTLFSYIQDSFGYAAEALVGRFKGANNPKALRHSIINMFWWSGCLALVFVIVYVLFWKQIIIFFGASPTILECAGHYIVWITIVPLAGFAPFLMDGIFIGATQTRILRDSMAISTLIFFGIYYGLVNQLGATALWLAFVVFVASRGITQLIMSRGLEGLVRHKSSSQTAS